MPAFKSKPPKGKPVAHAKGAGQSKNKLMPAASDGDDDDDDDDDEIDEDDDGEEPDDLDEDVDEDLDEIDEDVSLDEDDSDEEEDDETERPPAKKQKLSGNGAAKDTDKKDKLKDKQQQKDTKKPADQKEPKKKDAKETATTAEKDKGTVEDRSTAVGPLTEAEIAMFSENFKAMSATSVFVGKLPEDATEEELKKLHPAIRIVRRPVTRKGLPRTFAFLNFPNKETANRALKEINSKGPVKIRGQEIVVSENGNGQCHPPGLVDRRKLKIYGCPKHVSKEEIQKQMGCVDVLLSDRDKGHAIEAVAVYRSSADAKKVLDSHQTVTLNEAICAIFYLNISHNVKQHERKKDRKQQIKKEVKERKARTKARAAGGQESDDEGDDGQDDDDDGAEDSGSEGNSTPLKPAKKPGDKQSNTKLSSMKPLKRPLPEEDSGDDEGEEDDDDEEEESPMPKKSSKKVSMKTPLKTPTKGPMQKKSPRKGTPFKHNGLAGKPLAKKMKV